MSIQIFLQAKLLGIRDFLGGTSEEDDVFLGCSWWTGLIMEALPRALLSELGLARILLGSSGGGQFLVVIPQEAVGQADQFLEGAAREISAITNGTLKLVWASTENLGDWAIVRRRLRETLNHRRGVSDATGDFSPTAPGTAQEETAWFRDTIFKGLIEQKEAGWSPDSPGRIHPGRGVPGRAKYTWGLGSGHDQLPWTRQIALSDDGEHPSDASELGRRAEGTHAWGVLRGDVDSLDVRFRRAQSVEEHIQLSVLYKQFFAGELEVLCSMPEFWRKVTVIYSGGDDFAAYGAWDALILLAREMHRLFRRFSEESLKDFPGAEGKTISMSLALAPTSDARLSAVFEEAGRILETAKCSSRDCFAFLGRVLEWRQVGGASELKDTMVRIAREFGGSTQFLRELAAFYRDEVFSPVTQSRRRDGELDRPWRLHRRVLRVLPPARDRELERLRNSLIVELVGKNASQIKLRPAGRVALEWARLTLPPAV